MEITAILNTPVASSSRHGSKVNFIGRAMTRSDEALANGSLKANNFSYWTPSA
jgi:hypothetical protein